LFVYVEWIKVCFIKVALDVA